MIGAVRQLWDEYFNIPPDGFISDRVLLVRLTLGVLIIVICMACIGWSAWALFDSGSSADLASAMEERLVHLA